MKYEVRKISLLPEYEALVRFLISSIVNQYKCTKYVRDLKCVWERVRSVCQRWTLAAVALFGLTIKKVTLTAQLEISIRNSDIVVVPAIGTTIANDSGASYSNWNK